MNWLNRFKDAERKCLGIPAIELKIAETNSLYSNIEKNIDLKIIPKLDKLDTISNALNNLIIYLSGKDQDMDAHLFLAKSPIQLTDLAEEILQAMGGKKYIDENIGYLLSTLEKEPIKSALDVEISSRIILLRELNSDAFTPIKDFIFLHPKYRKGNVEVQLDIPSATSIMGIYLRDKYLEKHSQLKSQA